MVPPVEAISRCEDLVSMELYSESFSFVDFSSWRHLLLNNTLATGPHCADTGLGWGHSSARHRGGVGAVVLTGFVHHEDRTTGHLCERASTSMVKYCLTLHTWTICCLSICPCPWLIDWLFPNFDHFLASYKSKQLFWQTFCFAERSCIFKNKRCFQISRCKAISGPTF